MHSAGINGDPTQYSWINSILIENSKSCGFSNMMAQIFVGKIVVNVIGFFLWNVKIGSTQIPVLKSFKALA
jgi:hypothetical protein